MTQKTTLDSGKGLLKYEIWLFVSLLVKAFRRVISLTVFSMIVAFIECSGHTPGGWEGSQID